MFCVQCSVHCTSTIYWTLSEKDDTALLVCNAISFHLFEKGKQGLEMLGCVGLDYGAVECEEI